MTVVNVISSIYTIYRRFLPGLDIHIFPRVEQSKRIKLESILTLVTENANRKFVAVTARIECCPYKPNYADNSVCIAVSSTVDSGEPYSQQACKIPHCKRVK